MEILASFYNMTKMRLWVDDTWKLNQDCYFFLGILTIPKVRSCICFTSFLDFRLCEVLMRFAWGILSY
jgi:hypothetical protein